MIKKKDKIIISELYDIELSKLPRLDQIFNSDEILKLKKDMRILTNDDKKVIEDKKNDILRIHKNIFNYAEEKFEQVEQYIEEPNITLATEVDYCNSDSFARSMFVTNDYESYFFSKLANHGNKNIMVKVSVCVLGGTLFNVKDEVIFIDDYVIEKLGTEFFETQHESIVSMKFCERMFDTYKKDNIYFCNEHHMIENIDEYKKSLKENYRIDVDFSKLYKKVDETWNNVGHQIYDNRLEGKGKVKTIRSQIR